MKRFGNFLWGLVFIVLGIIIAINVLGIAKIDIFFDGWWTLFIIIPCFIGIFKENEKTGNIIGLIIGVLLLLCARDYISFDLIFKLILPIIFIGIGISFIFKDTIHKKVNDKIKDLNKSNLEEYTSTFSGQKVSLKDDEFKGTTLNAIFGAIEFDIKETKITQDSVINASAIFGGIDILVPPNINVKVKSNSIFGGVSNKCENTKENVPTLYINATCLFGGVEIK